MSNRAQWVSWHDLTKLGNINNGAELTKMDGNISPLQWDLGQVGLGLVLT